MSATAQCPHGRVHFHHDVTHMTDNNVVMLELTARCEDCEQPLAFLGEFPVGVSFERATLSIDRLTLSLPMITPGERPRISIDAVIGRVSS